MSRTSFISFLVVLLVGVTSSSFATSTPTIELEKAVHFLTPGGEDVVVEQGRYEVDQASEWLHLIPVGGEKTDAILVEAQPIDHQETIEVPTILSRSEHEDEHMITLLFPDGTGLEALGSYSGVRSKAVRRPSRRPRVGRSSKQGLRPLKSARPKTAVASDPSLKRPVKSPVSRQTKIGPKALRPAALAALKPGRKILLPWFDGKKLRATTKMVQPRRGLVHLYGAIEKKGRDPFTDVFLTIRGNTLIGTVFRGGKVFRLIPKGKAGYRLIQTESSQLSMGDDAISFDDRKMGVATVRRAKPSRGFGSVRKRGLQPQSDTPPQIEGESVPPIPPGATLDEAHANLQDFSVEESYDTSSRLPSHSSGGIDAVGERELKGLDDISPEIDGEPDTPISRGVTRKKARKNRSGKKTPRASTPQLRPNRDLQPKRHTTPGILEKPQLALIRDDGSRIDLLIVYTPEAENRFRLLAGDDYGNHGFDIFIFFEHMVWTTNRILSESHVSTRLNIVGIERIGSYQASDPQLEADIYKLRDGVGPFNVVDALRVNKRADLVSAFLDIPKKINGKDTRCGVGAWPWLVPFNYVNQGKGAFGRTYAFSIVDMYCEFQWGEVFAHEIGHNLGARHDFYVMESQVTMENEPLEPNKPQHIGPFGFILEHTNPPAKTIMAYSDFCEKVLKKTCPTVHRYSSPLVHHEGLPLGVLGTSPSDGAYNAKVMYLYRETAANYLNSHGVPPDTPGVPSDAP